MLPFCACSHHSVVSTEQYSKGFPSKEVRFPDMKDLSNYTKKKEVSEIVIPPSLIEEKLNQVDESG